MFHYQVTNTPGVLSGPNPARRLSENRAYGKYLPFSANLFLLFTFSLQK